MVVRFVAMALPSPMWHILSKFAEREARRRVIPYRHPVHECEVRLWLRGNLASLLDRVVDEQEVLIVRRRGPGGRRIASGQRLLTAPHRAERGRSTAKAETIAGLRGDVRVGAGDSLLGRNAPLCSTPSFGRICGIGERGPW